MCGRFTLRTPASVVAKQFGLLEAPELAARFNIAPSQPVAVVRARAAHPSAAAAQEPAGPQRELVFLRWGLIPSWAKDAAVGNRMINARAETAAQKPAFRTALRRRRCLLAADGFYEWQRAGKQKQPYYIRLSDDRPFGFAGLWEAWQGPDQQWIESCTLLTTDANELLRPIHDRMPVILPPEAYGPWLDPAVQDPEQLAPLCKPYPSEAMTVLPVGTLVNSPTNEDPRCIEPA
jgi:putative SOS response-associated peptidase YedK